MTRVVVVGGYGHLGSRCVAELAGSSDADLVVAGRNGQRAERLALAYGERVSGAYLDAADPRTLSTVLPGSDCLLVCSGPDSLALVEAALRERVPLVVAGELAIDQAGRTLLAEAAWDAQLPFVIEGGAVPGLVGLVAEQLVRSLEELAWLRVATTGPWRNSEAAQRSVTAQRTGRVPNVYRSGEWRRAGFERSVRLECAGSLDRRRLRPAPPVDLESFVDAHLVERAVYLEPGAGPLDLAMNWMLGEPPEPLFNLRAEAESPQGASAFVEIEAEDACVAAAVSLAALVRGVLARNIAAGLSTPREAVNPTAHLGALEKRGLLLREGRTE